IIFNVSASGANLFIQIYPSAEDNSFFIINPTTDRINDSDPYDNDPSLNMLVTFNITVPSNDGYYILFIIAGDASGSPPPFAILEIGFSVGGVAPPGVDWLSIIF
ncbi:MAG: hypothetical protein ACW972_12825, partial [Promethearchaeota archaeon]